MSEQPSSNETLADVLGRAIREATRRDAAMEAYAAITPGRLHHALVAMGRHLADVLVDRVVTSDAETFPATLELAKGEVAAMRVVLFGFAAKVATVRGETANETARYARTILATVNDLLRERMAALVGDDIANARMQ